MNHLSLLEGRETGIHRRPYINLTLLTGDFKFKHTRGRIQRNRNMYTHVILLPVFVREGQKYTHTSASIFLLLTGTSCSNTHARRKSMKSRVAYTQVYVVQCWRGKKRQIHNRSHISYVVDQDILFKHVKRNRKKLRRTFTQAVFLSMLTRKIEERHTFFYYFFVCFYKNLLPKDTRNKIE